MRLNKYLAKSGIASRRRSDELIKMATTTVNNEIILDPAYDVNDFDEIRYDGELLQIDKEKIVIVFNKPKNVITSIRDPYNRKTVMDYIQCKKKLAPVGRLDKDSEGLIIMTNDGDIVNKILRSNNDHEKEYIVTVDKKVTKEFIRNMAKGVPILDTITKPCRVEQINVNTFRIILTEGLNRQIRRMCTHFGYQVTKLKRIRIMNLRLDIAKGEYRELTKEERNVLFKQLKYSIMTEEASK